MSSSPDNQHFILEQKVKMFENLEHLLYDCTYKISFKCGNLLSDKTVFKVLKEMCCEKTL